VAPIGLFLILFAETGILIGLVLPGDSLLFTAGLLSSIHRHGDVHLNLWLVLLATTLGAIAGAQTGYLFGRTVGPRLFSRPESRIFKQQHLERTRTYLHRYGPAKAIIVARFVPLVRTLMNPLAGAIQVEVGLFTIANVVGGVVWTFSITIAGYYLGKTVHNVDRYVLPIIALAVVLSVIPVLFEILKTRRKKKGKGKSPVDEPVG
jgi:membrane-associated protein